MFKLTSLSSPTDLFHKIVFKDGLNIILGRYSKAGKDINGIGKTTIIKFIDYCLLSDGVKADFFSEKYSFLKTETVKLEFKLGNNNCSIERGFEDRRKVLYRVNDGALNEFTDTDLRLILGAEMGKGQSGVYDPLWFRTLMSFYLQNDHNFSQRDPKNVLKFTVGKRQPELFAYIFFLLGIDNTLIWDFDNNSVELKKLRSDQSRINKQITEQTGKSIEDFRGECDAIVRKIDKLESGLDNYNFDENTSNIESKILILNSDISELNKQRIALASKFKQIKESLKIDIDVDPKDVANFYSQIHSEFSDFILKSLDEVVKFREDISSNRKKFLKEREVQYQNKLNSIKTKVVGLEENRSKLYGMLDEQSAFDALKSAYLNLIDEKANLSGQLAYIEQLDSIEEAIADRKLGVGNTVKNILAEKPTLAKLSQDIKNVYLDLVEGSVDIESSDISPYFNIEFKANQNSPVKLSLEVPRGSSLGKGRFKILAFDLTVFICSLKGGNNLPSFMIHDGVFHAIAHKTRIKFLNYINKMLNSFEDVQYIITVNEDEIIFPELEGVSVALDFKLEDRTLITLEDKPEAMFLSKEFG
ncbi:DUF2326 domain-containing protein [Shewanella psychromarinicola]|uniref:DUF2326 domain-containing protein n=1 Tax=Shewanella psychromarinicola TaxID=2487742 RepID=A0A3N4DWL7_9GAMM|nr:DUF2326 domain-containing protein [Shewanella psychromarinicola]AZG35750.1 DUF2326 domain-containing protein [Shewanella psychromarinicola]MCL1081442.1 DUF2326 domain-containing protein [Shewanella psychromarinicola]RPA30325.1 DUF2326 domain-containing protein [Shewanella psychromarinicola]